MTKEFCDRCNREVKEGLDKGHCTRYTDNCVAKSMQYLTLPIAIKRRYISTLCVDCAADLLTALATWLNNKE